MRNVGCGQCLRLHWKCIRGHSACTLCMLPNRSSYHWPEAHAYHEHLTLTLKLLIAWVCIWMSDLNANTGISSRTPPQQQGRCIYVHRGLLLHVELLWHDIVTITSTLTMWLYAKQAISGAEFIGSNLLHSFMYYIVPLTHDSPRCRTALQPSAW